MGFDQCQIRTHRRGVHPPIFYMRENCVETVKQVSNIEEEVFAFCCFGFQPRGIATAQHFVGEALEFGDMFPFVCLSILVVPPPQVSPHDLGRHHVSLDVRLPPANLEHVI